MSTTKDNRKLLSAVFRHRADATAAYDYLVSRGYTSNEINVLMSDKTRDAFSTDTDTKVSAGSLATEGMGTGGAIGTAVGAIAAAIAAVGTSVAVPGLGLMVAGPIAAALAGGGAGAALGGTLGALIGSTMTESNANAYEEALKNGGVVIGVSLRDNDDGSDIKKRFEELHGENVHSA